MASVRAKRFSIPPGKVLAGDLVAGLPGAISSVPDGMACLRAARIELHQRLRAIRFHPAFRDLT